jgi:hypothetical protein
MKDKWMKEYENHPLYTRVHEALKWYGAILPGWRIRINMMCPVNYQDAMIDVSVWEPRKVNPSIAWRLYTDTFRNIIDFNKSEFTYIKA